MKNKSLAIPSWMMIVSVIGLTIINVAFNANSEEKTIAPLLLLLPVAVLLIPSHPKVKKIISQFALGIVILLLIPMVCIEGALDFLNSVGPFLVFYALGFVLLLFAGHDLTVIEISILSVYTMFGMFMMAYHIMSYYGCLVILIFSIATLLVAGISGWLGKEKTFNSLFAPTPFMTSYIVMAGTAQNGLIDYIANLFVFDFLSSNSPIEPREVKELLANASFLGNSLFQRGDEANFQEVNLYVAGDRKLLTFLACKDGWFIFIVAGLLIAVLIVGAVLLAVRQKGLGRYLAIAVLGVEALPLCLFFFSNLGLFEADVVNPAFLSTSFISNLLSFILLRMAITFTKEAPVYQKCLGDFENSVFDIDLGDEDEDKDARKGEDEDLDVLRVTMASGENNCKTLCKMFEGPWEIPFKNPNIAGRIKDKEILFSIYKGGTSYASRIFEQLKFVGADNIVRITVNDQMDIPPLLHAMERLTNAMSEQKNVDFCLRTDEDVPKKYFSMMVITVKDEDSKG